MGAAGNVEWLRKALAKAVGWEEAMMEGVADAIATAESKEELNQLVQVLLSLYISMITFYYYRLASEL
jgi:hypothetical protein